MRRPSNMARKSAGAFDAALASPIRFRLSIGAAPAAPSNASFSAATERGSPELSPSLQVSARSTHVDRLKQITVGHGAIAHHQGSSSNSPTAANGLATESVLPLRLRRGSERLVWTGVFSLPLSRGRGSERSDRSTARECREDRGAAGRGSPGRFESDLGFDAATGSRMRPVLRRGP